MSDVAAVARVGKITVSRVLNGSPHVAEKTKKRVLAAVKKLSYVPDESARALRLQKSHCIGLIVPALIDHFFAICAHVIHETAEKHGYMVMTVSSNGDPDTEANQIQAMLRRRIDGIVLVPASNRKCLLSTPEYSSMPAVAFDRPIANGEQDLVMVENQRGAKMAVEHLVEHGHRRIAYLGPSGSLFTIAERLRGFRKAAEKSGIETQEFSCIDDLQQTIAVLKELRASDAPPTAVFTPNNVTTQLVMEAILELDIDVPGTLALVGFDNFELAHVLQPPVTVVSQPVEEMARCAAEMLFERLQDGGAELPPRKIKLPVQLLIRNSCGCKRGVPHVVAPVSV
jgi:LacI family transcriptional regulator